MSGGGFTEDGSPPGGGKKGDGPRNGVILTPGSEITPKPYDFIWPDWLCKEKLEMLGGAPGAGKTTIALGFAAELTRGGHWPDGTRVSEPGEVLFWSGEDGTADTLMPRFIVMGGVPERIHFVSGVMEDGQKRAFDPSVDMPSLTAAAARLKGRLQFTVIDPVVMMVTKDSHKNAETRRDLQPLVSFAENMRVCALGITHLTKGTAGRDPLERLAGSLAFGAGPRLAMVAAKPLDRERPRRLIRVKSNIGPDGGGFEYSLRQEPLIGWNGGLSAQRAEWGEFLDGTPRDLLNDVELPKNEPPAQKRDLAVQFLQEALKDGPVPMTDLAEEAKAAGLSWATVRRAADVLGVTAEKTAFRGGWAWRLPEGDVPAGEEREI